MLCTLLWSAFIFGSALGVSVPQTHELHERRTPSLSRWRRGDRTHPHRVHPMRIGLAQNLEGAEDLLYEVSDPVSPKYAQYWTAEEVIEKFKPSSDTIIKVHTWLTQHGIHEHRITHSDNKAWFAFDVTSEEAEHLLHTEFYEYQDAVSGQKILACDQYHLPKALRSHIDYVTPGVKLLAPHSAAVGSPLKRRSLSAQRKAMRIQRPVALADPPAQAKKLPPKLQYCDQQITPECINALYQIPPTNKHRPPIANNSIGVLESGAGYYNQDDLNLFFRNYTPFIPQNTRPRYFSIDGAPGPTKNQSESGVEPMLDIELAYAIVYPQTVTIYQEDDTVYEQNPNITFTFGFNTWLDAIDGSYCTFSAYGETGDSSIDPQYPDLQPGGYKGKLQCGVYETTNVVSVSFGGQEADLPAAYQKRQCLEYLKLGLQGVSILFASGDAGVGNFPAPYGFDDPKTGCLGKDGLLFNPTWPNNCPYITNVGGTKVYPGKTVLDPESALFDPATPEFPVNGSSGGGFSNLYATPRYQQKAISMYLTKHKPLYKSYAAVVNDTSEIANLGKNGGVYNRIGRGIPDVAAVADNIAVTVHDQVLSIGGTSASTPIFAAIVNRINEERLRRGKKPVGFMNPTLYQHPDVFNDITNGTNPGCETDGFSAVEGWDPVTGLGTPRFPKLLELYLSLP